MLERWLTFKGECAAFIAIKDPDEPENLWTVWSDDRPAFSGGGRKKNIFGKEFEGVCGCTFRVDNPQRSDLPFLKKMVELSILRQ